MPQIRSFIALLLVLAGISGAITQNTSSSRQAALAEAKQASARQTAGFGSMPAGHVPRPAPVNRHALMTTHHPDVAEALSQAKLPSSGKAYSFPEFSRVSFLSPASVHRDVFPESRMPEINKQKLRMAKPHNVQPLP